MPESRQDERAHFDTVKPPLSRMSLILSPPRENVLLVPGRNVLLTRSGWEGVRTRKPHHDATRQRPSGRAQEDEEETDQAIAGGQGVGHLAAPGTAASAPFTRAGRCRRDTRATRTSVESAGERRDAAEDRAGALARGISRFRTDTGGRVPAQEAWGDDRSRGTTADHDRGRVVAGAKAESGGHSQVEVSAELPRRSWCSGTPALTSGWKGVAPESTSST